MEWLHLSFPALYVALDGQGGGGGLRGEQKLLLTHAVLVWFSPPRTWLSLLDVHLWFLPPPPDFLHSPPLPVLRVPPPPRPGSRVIQQGDDPAPALPPIGKTRSLTLRAGNSGAHALQSCFAGSIIFSTVRKTRVFSCRLRAPRALQMAPPAGWGWPRAQRQRPLEESRCLLTTCLSLKAWSVRLWNWSSESPQSRGCWSAGLTPHVPTVPVSTPHYTGFRLLEPNTKL